ncbi:MAG: HlyD family efflux transporter periplasmic adaptor subunit [Nitrospirales bacterium]
MDEQPSQDFPLPPLRDDIQIVKGIATLQGEPTWTIIDPIRNTYFQIGWGAFQILSRWEAGTLENLIATVTAETTSCISKQEVQELILFLSSNHLTQGPLSGGSAAFAAQVEAGQQHWIMALVHHYLFVKVPLAQPDHLLKTTLPYIAPLMTKSLALIVILLGVIGVFLVSRQWDTFINTFLHMFTLEGMAAFGLALCGVKVLHELGHAYTATKFGCRVHTMGVAFLVMFPVLYTDTTDAWRLTHRRERLTIAAAGVIVELVIAMLATFLWNFLPDGILRSVAFTLATTSWVMSVAINLNPLLRFDGYYFLSDWLGVPNLQHRAFALGRWKMREWAFGLGVQPPETFPPKMRNFLIIYAWSIWAFRFFLFLGIALLVYHFFFKLLGIILFALEIIWFILMPIIQELKEWWKLREDILPRKRLWISGTLLVSLSVLACIPWNTRVTIPAILQAKHHTIIFTPAPGRLLHVSMTNGQTVRNGEVLAIVKAPTLERDILQAQQHITALKIRLKRLSGNAEYLEETPVLMEELKMHRSKLDGLREMQGNLELKAPFSGVVMDLQSSLHPDRWINETLPLVHLIKPEQMELVGLAPETDIPRLAVGQAATFIPDDLMRPTSRAKIREIREVDEQTLVIPYLASTFGGDIAVRKDQNGNLHPEAAVYRVTLTPSEQPLPADQVIKGVIQVNGEPRSFLRRLWTWVITGLISEMGF